MGKQKHQTRVRLPVSGPLRQSDLPLLLPHRYPGRPVAWGVYFARVMKLYGDVVFANWYDLGCSCCFATLIKSYARNCVPFGVSVLAVVTNKVEAPTKDSTSANAARCPARAPSTQRTRRHPDTLNAHLVASASAVATNEMYGSRARCVFYSHPALLIIVECVRVLP